MAAFTFSAEEVRSAPPAVRQWMESAIAATLRESLGAHRPSLDHQPELAACTAEEALQIFQMIRQDLGATLVFLELGHEPIGTTGASLCVFDISEVIHHTRLTEPRVAQSFMTINQIFQELRTDPQATLFGFDQANRVYIHAATHQSIRGLWESLIQRGTLPMATANAPFETSLDVEPSKVGPSENIAAHIRS